MQARTVSKAEAEQLLRECPVAATIGVIGGKWKPQIVHALLYGTLRFGELRRALPGVTQQMLTAQLRELERDGVIHREVYREVPPKVEYSLTPLGRSLDRIIAQMYLWGEAYLAGQGVAPGRLGASLLPDWMDTFVQDREPPDQQNGHEG